LSRFQIAELELFEKAKSQITQKLYEKIKNFIYPQLRENPFFGANIKKLKGEFEEYYRYRLGDYRLFYAIENEKVLVVIIDIKKRDKAYKK